MILGLDVSTSCTGLCLLSPEGLAAHDYIKLNRKKHTDLFVKAESVREKLLEVKEQCTVKHVVIERSVLRMGRGMSSAHTINLLSRFNGIVSWLCYDIFDMVPTFLDARVARKRVGIEVPKGSDAKTQVVQHLMKHHKFGVEYTAKGNVVPAFYDMADAYVMALAFERSALATPPPTPVSGE